jgi:hypothetical protein
MIEFVPRGYGGREHITLGSDILAVLDTISNPEIMLGQELFERLSKMENRAWYPIKDLLDLLELVSQRTGRATLIKMGRQLFKNTHATRIKDRSVCAGDMLFGIHDMYHHANRGFDIGGWTVLHFSPGRALIEKTTPHHCGLEEGIVLESLSSIGAESLLVQKQCVREKAESCIFELLSPTKDALWMGTYPIKTQPSGVMAKP